MSRSRKLQKLQRLSRCSQSSDLGVSPVGGVMAIIELKSEY